MIKRYDDEKDLWTIEVTVDIDMYSVPDFKELIYDCIAKHKADFLIDCAGMDYIDSTGLGVLVSCFFKVKEYGRNIKIIGLKPHIMKIFEITGLQNIFDLEEAR